ncbi:hypothetical protein Tco_0864267 [Tanacetum coccineum]
MTQAAIRKLVADSVTAALEAQAANMANTDNTTRPRELLTESVFSCSNVPERLQVSLLLVLETEESSTWWNSFGNPIGIKEA